MFLSIIIPVHNGDKYLQECLESCFNQNISIDEYQVICIDDGSTDNSKTVLSYYKTKYMNFVYSFQEQGGVGKARNHGLQIAKGDYVWFVDADDFIENNILRDVFSIIKQSNCDRLKLASYCFINELSDIEKRKKDKGLIVSNYPYKNTQITRTIIKRSFIENHKIFFHEQLFYGEDTLFNFETRIHEPLDCYFSKVVYYYRKHINASTSFDSEIKIIRYFISCYRAISIVGDYYIQRISSKLSREMLIYWLDNFFVCGGKIDKTKIKNIIDAEAPQKTIKVQQFDFRLVGLYRTYKKVIFQSQYDLLKRFHKKHEKNRIKKLNHQIQRKKIFGYLKHPRRLINMKK